MDPKHTDREIKGLKALLSCHFKVNLHQPLHLPFTSLIDKLETFFYEESFKRFRLFLFLPSFFVPALTDATLTDATLTDAGYVNSQNKSPK